MATNVWSSNSWWWGIVLLSSPQMIQSATENTTFGMHYCCTNINSSTVFLGADPYFSADQLGTRYQFSIPSPSYVMYFLISSSCQVQSLSHANLPFFFRSQRPLTDHCLWYYYTCCSCWGVEVLYMRNLHTWGVKLHPFGLNCWIHVLKPAWEHWQGGNVHHGNANISVLLSNSFLMNVNTIL